MKNNAKIVLGEANNSPPSFGLSGSMADATNDQTTAGTHLAEVFAKGNKLIGCGVIPIGDGTNYDDPDELRRSFRNMVCFRERKPLAYKIEKASGKTAFHLDIYDYDIASGTSSAIRLFFAR